MRSIDQSRVEDVIVKMNKAMQWAIESDWVRRLIRAGRSGGGWSAAVVILLAVGFWLPGAWEVQSAWATGSAMAAVQDEKEKKSDEKKEDDKNENQEENSEESEDGDKEDQEEEKSEDQEKKESESADDADADKTEGEKKGSEEKDGNEKKDVQKQDAQEKDAEKKDGSADKEDSDETDSTQEADDEKTDRKDEAKPESKDDESAETESEAENQEREPVLTPEDFENLEVPDTTLSEEDLEEMKRILMERVAEQVKEGKGQPPRPTPKKTPARTKTTRHPGARPGVRPPAKKPAGKTIQPKRSSGKPTAGAKKGSPTKAVDPKSAKPKRETPKERNTMRVQPRPSKPGAPKPITRRTKATRDTQKAKATRNLKPDDALTGDKSGFIFPTDLPEGVHIWELSDDDKRFFLSFERVSPVDILNDFSRFSGLSIIGMEKVKGQPVTYQALEYMSYWDAFETINELLKPQGIVLLPEEQHLRIASTGDIRQYIQPKNVFSTRPAFEESSIPGPVPAKVFFVPPSNVAPTQVAQWINDLPDSIRLGSTSPGNMHVTGMSKDIRKLFFLVDIVNAQNPADMRVIGWIPIEKGDVEQIADLVRQFIGEDAKPGAKSIRPRGKKSTSPQLGPLEDFAGVDVLAVPAAKMLMIKAKPSKLEEAKRFVRQIMEHVPIDEPNDPVVIPLQHAKADEIVPLLESVMGGAAVSLKPGKAPGRKIATKRAGARTQANTIQLSTREKQITILPEPHSNALIVIADPEGVERVRMLLKIFDVPQIATTFEFVKIEYARVETVQQLLGTLFPSAGPKRVGKKSAAATSTQDLTMIPDPAANTLFLAGKQDAINKAKEIIAKLDIPTVEPVRHMVTLVNQTPTTLATLLQKIEGGGKGPKKGAKSAGPTEGTVIIPFDETNTLIVICPQDQWPDYKKLIEELDRGVEDFLVTRTFKIEKADVNDVASLLKEWFGASSASRPKSKRRGATAAAKPGGLAIVVDEPGSQIFVRGDEETVTKMADFIIQIESGFAQTDPIRRTFRLTYMSAQDAVKVLTTLYPKAGGKKRGKAAAGDDAVRYAVAGQSVLLIEAAPDLMEEIAGLIAELDSEEQDNTEIRPYEVDGADPQQLVRDLKEMFKKTIGRGKSAKTSGPTFIASGKKIIAIAEPGEFRRIEEAIEVLRQERTAIVVEQFQVEFADPADIAKQLPGLLEPYVNEFVGGATGGKGAKGPGKVVTVNADPRTGTLFVAAPGQVMTHVAELIRILDEPTVADTEPVIVRNVILKKAEVGELIGSLQKMMQGGVDTRPQKAAAKTGPRSFHARMTGKMKGQVTMVPAPGANSVILRGIESDVEQVEGLIAAIDNAAVSSKKVAQRYDAMPTGMAVDDLADMVMAMMGGGPKKRAKDDDDLFGEPVGPRITKDMIINTDWYSDTMIVVATPEKQEEVSLLIEALSSSIEGMPEPDLGAMTMVKVEKADPEYVIEVVEGILDELISRGPKTKLVLVGSDTIALKGPQEQIAVVMGWIEELDIAGVTPPTEFEIRVPETTLATQDLLKMVVPRLRGMDVQVIGVSLTDDGESDAERYGIEEIAARKSSNNTLGPATLAHISAEIHRLMAAAAQDPDGRPDEPPADQPEPAANAPSDDEQSDNKPESQKENKDDAALPASIASMGAAHKAIIKITVDPATGALLIEGAPKDIREFNEQLDKLLVELDKLKTEKPDIRVFRLRYINVTEAARIMETILGAQMGGAASRQQQQLQQARKLQQNQQRQQQVRQQQQMQKMLRQMAGGGGKAEVPEEDAEEPEEDRDEGPKRFGESRIQVYPDTRTSTIVVRAATADYPVILELMAKIDKPPTPTEFKVFKLKHLQAADVETAIKTILRLDRQTPTRRAPQRGRAGQLGQQNPQAQLIQQLQQQVDAMQDTGGEGVAINWAEQVTITSESSTNTILVAGPTQAIAHIQRMIEELEGQEIDKETVKTIQLKHASVSDILPTLTDVFASGGGGKTRPGAKGAQVVETAFSQVVLSGDPRTNTLIVKALDTEMEEVEKLIRILDVETEGGKPELIPVHYGDAAGIAGSVTEMFVTGDPKGGNVRIVAVPNSNSILVSAPSSQRADIVSQIQDLDKQARSSRQARIIPIVYGNPELIAQQLQPIFGGRSRPGVDVSITGNNMAKKLIVVAPDDVFEEIEKLVPVLDVPTSESTIQIYEIQHAVAEEVLARMQDVITQMVRNKITVGAGAAVDMDAFAATADPRTNSLIVLGSPGVHAMIGTVLGQIDVPQRGIAQMKTMVFPLKASNAMEVARQVTDLFKNRIQGGTEPPVATPNPGLNILFVRGTQAQLDEVNELVQNLEGAEVPQLESFTRRLVHADAEQTAVMLEEHFRKKSDRLRQSNRKGGTAELGVSITPDPNTNQIFVHASAADRDRIDELLAIIDVPEAKGASKPNTRVFVIEHGQPTAIAGVVNAAFPPRPGRTAPKDRVQAVPDAVSGTVVVIASEDNMESISKLIREMDTETSSRQTFTYKAVEARALELVTVLRDYVTQSSRGGGRGQTPITLVANEPTNTILIGATPQEYEKLLPIIQGLDVPAESETGRFARAYKLSYSDPGALVQIVQSAFQVRGRSQPEDMVSAAVAWATSTLIVTASAKNHEKISNLLKEIDVPSEDGITVRPIEVTYADPREVAMSLTAMFVQGIPQQRGGPQISITNPAGTKLVLVRSDERTFQEIMALVGQIDQSDASSNEMQVFSLVNLEPAEAKTILEDRFRKTGARGNELTGDMRITESDSLNAVVVTGSAEQLEQVARVIEEIDLDPGERGDVPQIIQLVHADAGQLAETLSQMFGTQRPQGRRGRPGAATEGTKIIPVVHNNSLLIKAKPRQMNEIRSMIEILDTEAFAAGVGGVEIIQVAQNINVEEMASIVQNAVNDGERARAESIPGASAAEIAIQWDNRTNSLILAGDPKLYSQARNLIETLEKSGPMGANKVVIRTIKYRSPQEIKTILEELTKGKSTGSSSRSPGRRPTNRRRR